MSGSNPEPKTAAPTRRRARGLPELVSVLAIVGIGWRLWPSHAPPAQLQCVTSGAPVDCFVRIAGATSTRGAQSTDRAAAGYDPDAGPTEGPVVVSDVASFWLQRTEATVGSWRRCVRAGRCEPADVGTGAGATVFPIDAHDDPAKDHLPINRITWKGAVDLCAFLGGRLPSEAEWELAARGTEGRRWPWGREARCAFPSRADGFPRAADDVLTCDQRRPLRVDALPEPTPEGVIGLGGNLWEWTADAWSPTVGGPPGAARTQRGGSYLAATPSELRATVRGGVDPTMQLDDVGVRCAVGGRP
jgi:formylglycine-generating enzyme required for sulfatase activity